MSAATTGPQAAEWKQYSDIKPAAEGVYRWRVPSQSCAGLIVTFLATMRARDAGHQTVLSPAFDQWDGYRVLVPEGTEWQELVAQPSGVRDHDYLEVEPEGVVNAPCPFCGARPTWFAAPDYICAGPHESREWSLKCCEWVSERVRALDPRALSERRNAALVKAGAR